MDDRCQLTEYLREEEEMAVLLDKRPFWQDEEERPNLSLLNITILGSQTAHKLL